MVKVYAISQIVDGEQRYLYIPPSNNSIPNFEWVVSVDFASSLIRISDARSIQKNLIAIAKGLDLELKLHIVQVEQENKVLRNIDEETLKLLDPPKEVIEEEEAPEE